MFKLLQSAAEQLSHFLFAEQIKMHKNGERYKQIRSFQELDRSDKNDWAGFLSFDIDSLMEDLPEVGLKDLLSRLREFESQLGRYSLSPWYYHDRMQALYESLISQRESTSDFEMKKYLILRFADRYRRLLNDTEFMEHCLMGEVEHIKAVFEGKRHFLGVDTCLAGLLYLKPYVNPMLYLQSVDTLREVFATTVSLGLIGRRSCEKIKKALTQESRDTSLCLTSGSVPKKLPLLWIKEFEKASAAAEVPTKTSIFSMLRALASYPIRHPKEAIVFYLLTYANAAAAIRTLQVNNAIAKNTEKAEEAHIRVIKEYERSKRFTGVTAPFQVSSITGTTPAVAPWGAGNFLDIWLNGSNSFSTGSFLKGLDGSLISSLSPIGSAITNTAASGAPNNGSLATWVLLAGVNSYTWRGRIIDSTGTMAAPFPIVTGLLVNDRISLSPHTFSNGDYAGIGEVSDGSGSGIQVVIFTPAGAVNCSVLANTFTTGDQLYGAVDVLDDDTVMAVYTRGTTIGADTGPIKAQKLGANCAMLGSEITIDGTSSNLTLPSIARIPGGFSATWFYKDVAGLTFETFQRYYNNTGNAVNSRLTLQNNANTNGDPPVTIGFAGGGSASAWQICSTSSNTGTNYVQFIDKFAHALGPNLSLGSIAYCGNLAATVSVDGNNLLISYSNKVGGQNYIYGVGIGLAFTATNLNTAQTYTQNTQYTFSQPLSVQQPSFNTANLAVSYTFSDASAGTLSIGSAPGVTVTSSPFTLTGSISAINNALSNLSFTPTNNYLQPFTLTIAISDTAGIAPDLSGAVSMTGSLTTPPPTTTNAPTTASPTTASPTTASGTTSPATTTAGPTGSPTASTTGPAPTSSGTPTGTQTGTQTATAGPTPTSSSSSSSSVGLWAGIGVGGTVVACLTVAGIFAARRCCQRRELEGQHKDNNVMLLADAVIKRLGLWDYEDFENGAGRSFYTAIDLIAGALKDHKGETLDVGPMLPDHIATLGDHLATVISSNIPLKREISIGKAHHGIHHSLDLIELRKEQNRQVIVDNVFSRVREKSDYLLKARGTMATP